MDWVETAALIVSAVSAIATIALALLIAGRQRRDQEDDRRDDRFESVRDRANSLRDKVEVLWEARGKCDALDGRLQVVEAAAARADKAIDDVSELRVDLRGFESRFEEQARTLFRRLDEVPSVVRAEIGPAINNALAQVVRVMMEGRRAG